MDKKHIMKLGEIYG